MKKSILLICMVVMAFLCYCPVALGQNSDKVVSGTVKSASDDNPLPGVNVLIKGTSIGAITDANGKYQLQVPSDNQQILVFSYVGYATMEIAIGDRSVVDISMDEDAQELGEVVVTALGIERDKKALGYSVQELDGEELTKTKSSNVVNSLSGRVAGVQVTGSSGSVGASSRIIIRGNSSFNAENQPLFVIDGVLVDNSQPRKPSEQNTATVGNNDGADYGNAATDINPDDVASITVLKGPTAAALYGSRAQNGVILITTKSGKGTKGLGISYSGSYVAEKTLLLPDFQNSFGQGGYGAVDGTDYIAVDESWGLPLDGRDMVDYLGNTVKWVPQPDNVKDFFETGSLQTHSVSLQGGNDKGNFRISYTDLRQTGVIPNTRYDRTNLGFNGGFALSDKITINASANYTMGRGKNRPQTGYNNFNPLQQLYNWFGRQVNMDQLRNYKDANGNPLLNPATGLHYNWNSSYHNNPFWIMNENTNNDRRNRLIGQFSITYDILPWLVANLRAGTDAYTDERKQIYRAGTLKPNHYRTGGFEELEYIHQSTNIDFTLTAKHDLGENFSFSLMAGGSRYDRRFRTKSTIVQGLAVPGIYNVANAASFPISDERLEEKRINSLYVSGQIGYRDLAFIEFTNRGDFSSVLYHSDPFYQYPSVTGTVVLSELIDLPSLDFAKVRVGYAEVGNDTDPYKQLNYYLTSEQLTTSDAGTIRSPYNGYTSFTLTSNLANDNLKPERTKSWEAGLEMQWFNNRLGVDFTYYNSLTQDQIVPLDISDATGYDNKLINAGEIKNSGVEIMLTGTPVQLNNSFQWDVFVNFAKNNSEVTSIHPNVKSLLVGAHRARLELRENQPYGLIVGTRFKRNDQGQLIIDGNGLPVQDQGTHVIGKVQPDYTMGIGNEFKFKGLSFSFLIDIKQGGDMFSLTNFFGNYAGVLETTVFDGKREDFIVEGVTESGSPNATPIAVEDYFHHTFQSQETAIYDASYAKLREVRLSYNLPSSFLNKTPFKRAQVSLIGRNLWLIHSNVPNVDPETSIGFSGNFQGFEVNNAPSTKSYGVSLNFSL
ncbi:SusC/RagA family TonB-linked outer membrane protein [Rapidithrix thailandica]|uniref:SusC/RagA family TonB-linked outer membrane protein n=1 Tax=Rapidithrix thailandica TaxID=413964 RepID=A0AAW9SFD7_9BACT